MTISANERATGLYVVVTGITSHTEDHVKRAVHTASRVCPLMMQALPAPTNITQTAEPRCIVGATAWGIGIFDTKTFLRAYNNMKAHRTPGNTHSTQRLSWQALAANARWDPAERKGLAEIASLAKVSAALSPLPRGVTYVSQRGYKAKGPGPGRPMHTYYFEDTALTMPVKLYLATLAAKSLWHGVPLEPLVVTPLAPPATPAPKLPKRKRKLKPKPTPLPILNENFNFLMNGPDPFAAPAPAPTMDPKKRRNLNTLDLNAILESLERERGSYSK